MANRPIDMPAFYDNETNIETLITETVDETYIKAKASKTELIAYCSVDPNKASTGEFTYRSGNRRGLKVFWATGGLISLERSDAINDDYIGSTAWLPGPGSEYVVKTSWSIPYETTGNAPIQLVEKGWTTGNAPNTGLPGYMTFVWINRAGSIAIADPPTTNTNSRLTFEVWKHNL